MMLLGFGLVGVVLYVAARAALTRLAIHVLGKLVGRLFGGDEPSAVPPGPIPEPLLQTWYSEGHAEVRGDQRQRPPT